MNGLIGFFLFFLLLPSEIYAGEEALTTNAGTVVLDLPKDWKAHKNLFSMPLAIVGPSGPAGTRSVLSIIGPGAQDRKAFFQPKALEVAAREFRDEKQKSLRRTGSRLQSFMPPQMVRLSQGQMISLGVRYLHKGKLFTDFTHKIICQERYFHAEATIGSENESQIPVIGEMLKGLRCR